MGTIGVVIPGVIIHDYLGEVFRGIADTAKQHGYSLITNIQNPRRHDNLAHLLAPGVSDGVVVVLPDNSLAVLDQCRASGRECVLIDYARDEDALLFPTVASTNYEGIMSAMQHLFALGHTHIGFISGDQGSATGRERLASYRTALQTAAIDYDPARSRRNCCSFHSRRLLSRLPATPQRWEQFRRHANWDWKSAHRFRLRASTIFVWHPQQRRH